MTFIVDGPEILAGMYRDFGEGGGYEKFGKLLSQKTHGEQRN
jgi:hypothetical protein